MQLIQSMDDEDDPVLCFCVFSAGIYIQISAHFVPFLIDVRLKTRNPEDFEKLRIGHLNVDRPLCKAL